MFPTVNFLGTPVDTYTLCVLLSFIVGFPAILILRPKAFPLKYVFWGLVIVIVFGFMGANFFNILIHASEYKGRGVKEIFYTSGLAYLGMPILGFFALWVYCRLIRLPFLVIADYAAPFFMLERAIGRVGCLGYGCCYGIPSGLPWAYPFKSWGIVNVVPRHPTQAYAIIYTFAILISSRYFYRKTKDARKIPAPAGWEKRTVEERKQLIRKAPSGGIIFFYVWLCYGFLRFFNEFLRAEGPFIYGPLNISQVILLMFVIISIIAMYIIIRRSAAKDEILKALKGALARLVVWLIASGIFLLSAISIYNRVR